MNLLVKWLLFVCFVFFLVTGGHTPDIRAEEEIYRHPDSPSSEGDSGFNPAHWLLSLYKNHISPVNGDSCPSYPSCSLYAEQAMKKHGFFMGWIMTVDRLIHEGKEETAVSPYINFDGEKLIFDPVENNDFWWHPRNGKHHE
jgi:hypothetical protein